MTTSNVLHLNSHLKSLKLEHFKRINYLQTQIKKQMEEIERLNSIISMYESVK